MNSRRVVWRLCLGLALVGVAAQAYLVQRAHQEMARIRAQLVPQGELRYQSLWPWPWGAGHLWGLSFQPEGLLRLSLQTPPGARVELRELRIHALRLDAKGQIERVEGRLIGLRIPDLALPVAALRASGPWSADPVQLSELGLHAMEVDVDFQIRYLADAELALLHLETSLPDAAALQLDLQLQGTPQSFARAPDQLRLRRLDLRYADQGLLTRYRALSAQRVQLNAADWERALLNRLDLAERSAGWSWDEPNTRALRTLIRGGRDLHLRFDPPCTLILRKLRRYPAAQWPERYGFSLTVEAPALAAGAR